MLKKGDAFSTIGHLNLTVPASSNWLDLGLSFPSRIEAQVFWKGKDHANYSDWCFSWPCSMKHASGRWPLCHNHQQLKWLGNSTLLFLKDMARVVGVTEAEILCGDWADPQWCRLPVLLGQGNERRDHFLFLLPLQSPIQLLMAKGPLKPPKIASCWKEVMQCTPQYAYWFLFLVLIKIYFSSLQVNSDLGLAAFHICSLGQWILVLTSEAVNSCLLLRYFNVNKWPRGGGRGGYPANPAAKKPIPFLPVVILVQKGLTLKLIKFSAGSWENKLPNIAWILQRGLSQNCYPLLWKKRNTHVCSLSLSYTHTVSHLAP